MVKVFLWGIIVLLCTFILGLVLKLVSVLQGIEEIREQFGRRLTEDTNIGLDISTGDKKVNRLARDLDRELKRLRKMEIRYQRGNQEIKNAITNISHDLRTPLTAILGYLELLEQENLNDEGREYLAIIEKRIFAMKELTEELFEYSVIVSVDNTVDKTMISINRMLEESLVAYYPIFTEVGIQPIIHMPEGIVKRMASEQAVMRIFSNIIHNVVKYSTGDFFVELEESGTIRFRNKAKNLDQIKVGRLFERFYTVENGRNSTGLGLSIAKALTEACNGNISANYQNGYLDIIVEFPK